LFWTGNTEEVLDEMKAFILNVEPLKVYEKQLFTIIVGRVLSHGETSSKHFQSLIENEVNKYKGTLVQKDEESFTATFNGPSQAVYCGIDLTEVMANSKAEIKIGIHIKECFADHSVSKEIAPLGTSMFEQAKPNQIVLTQTVKNLLIGVNLNFTAHKTVYDSGMNESILLYTVSKSDDENLTLDLEGQLIAAQTDSFLDKVLQTIDTHLSDEFFNVDILCKELGVSERQLQRKLKAITQKTPNQLISSARLKRAKELILKNDLTVSEVAFQTGFSNPSYFSKCFKKEFDISPSELKS
ncbi:MAG: helix-turn-helix transcriptional regulator, partial [Cryomorphaceae bacterium]